MDDLVAVELRGPDGVAHHVLTWGRVQATVDPEPLEALVAANAGKFGLEGASARVCWSMSDAREAPYFYECLTGITAALAARVASGTPYKKWLKKTDKRMRSGRDIWYCGDPSADRRDKRLEDR